MAFKSSLLLAISTLITLLLCFSLFSSPASPRFTHRHPSHSPRELLFEEKTRLGSTPPSCYNKCNDCHPCTAVKVPTLASLRQVKPPTPSPVDYDSFSGGKSEYSNYKPLGWKCRCKDHLYNP